MLRKKKPPVLRGKQKKRAQTEKIKNGEKEKNQKRWKRKKSKQNKTKAQTNDSYLFWKRNEESTQELTGNWWKTDMNTA